MWKECRKFDKDLRNMMKDQRRKAERKKEIISKISVTPSETLRVVGTKMKLIKDNLEYYAAENMEKMQLLKSSNNIFIDAFDARALLDSIPETYERSNAKPPHSDEENQINYERYKILVEKLALGSLYQFLF